MNYVTTNIFCIIANTGSDQELYLNHILNDKSFIRHTSLTRLVYNTTKPKNNKEDGLNKSKYHYYSIDEYDKMSRDNIIEFRSYYTIPYDTIYYFTLRNDIEDKENLLCITSPYQYESYKRWIAMENIRTPGRYNLYAILVHCTLKDRFKNKIESMTDSEDDISILEFCRRVLEDNAEFNDAKSRIPELNDPMNCNNVCYITNDKSKENDFKNNISIIKGFILDKVKFRLIC